MTAAAASETVQPAYRILQVGDPAPGFKQNSTSNPQFSFDTVAGRYIVLCFYGTGSDDIGRAALASFQEEHRDLFDDDKVAIFGVSMDPSDETGMRARQIVPGIRHFWDFDGAVGRLYGALPRNTSPGQSQVPIRRFWMVLNPTLRVRAVFPFEQDGSDREKVMAYLRALPPVDRFAGFEIPAPVLVIPDVFEPEFCRHLIGLYEKHGGEESGFMREVDGKTVAIHDASHKRRKDYTIQDQNLIRQVQHRIIRRINPEIERVHFFKPTRMERYIVSCYAAEDGGHFRAHRDNTTSGTAHRRFAVSINLNGDFEGGEVSFPEYGSRSYKAPPGGAVVFSCPLLHAVSRVTEGRRFAFLPFLYDEEAAKIREANNARLGEGVVAYKG
ncbi:2OG-Fe(II) oxygenase [Microvirga mediterraneensis]|uniref:2OG-Fe(II) oxygenase n=1 Tax=Microvirga mediterraneensis TaxID=2754695 RepID=A0A838BJ31_9HYPH|nr:2OG-Fe(II) oxygenase [Microvirga mediterraneensis]MBA1154963.1 2OG-Fe(II) oxygenase [Microvirga mediterraneensis]